MRGTTLPIAPAIFGAATGIPPSPRKVSTLNANDAFYAQYWTQERRNNFQSYINPNARCPVCNAPVYFYQASNGGRVFFDDLAPHWPKHPCTDNTLRTYRPVAYALLTPRKHTPNWEKEGWEPASVTKVDLPPPITRIHLKKIDSDGLQIIVGAVVEHPLPRDTLLFIREYDEPGAFKISYLDSMSQVGKVAVIETSGYIACADMADIELWQKALSGDRDAQNQLGLKILFPGDTKQFDFTDTNIDRTASLYWLNRAASAGHSAAISNLKYMELLQLKYKFEGVSTVWAQDFKK